MSDPTDAAAPASAKPTTRKSPKKPPAKKAKAKKPAKKVTAKKKAATKKQVPRKPRSDKGSKVPMPAPDKKSLGAPADLPLTQGKKKFTHIEASAFNSIQANIGALSEAIHRIPPVGGPYNSAGLHTRLEQALTEQLNALHNLTQEFFSTDGEAAPAASTMTPAAPEPLKPLNLSHTGGPPPAPAMPIYTDARGTPTTGNPGPDLPPPLAPTPIIG